jgi:hypothetical protein
MKESKGNKKSNIFLPFFDKFFRQLSPIKPLSKDLIDIYDNLNEPVFIIDFQKNIIWKNKAFKNFFNSLNFDKCNQICGNVDNENCYCLHTLVTGQIENNFRFSLFLITPNIKKYIKYFLSPNTRRIS